MNKLKVNRVVEYLRSVDFYHDAFDLEVLGVKNILSDYGVSDEFDQSELEQIKNDLLPIAVRNEINAILGVIHFQDEVGEVV